MTEAKAEETIPSWRLREESEARRLAESRAQMLEGRLNEIVTHLRQASGEEKPPDFFDDPAGITRSMVDEALKPYVTQTQRTLAAMGKMVAEASLGEEVVSGAEKAFLDAKIGRAHV